PSRLSPLSLHDALPISVIGQIMQSALRRVSMGREQGGEMEGLRRLDGAGRSAVGLVGDQPAGGDLNQRVGDRNAGRGGAMGAGGDRKSTRLNSSHVKIS